MTAPAERTAVGRTAADRTIRPSGRECEVRDRILAGDDAALREVYDQFASFVYGLALRVIGDTRAAEDVSQDVFVAFWERPGAFDPERGSLRPHCVPACWTPPETGGPGRRIR